MVTFAGVSAAVENFIAASGPWSAEMSALRPVLPKCGLAEELKWAKPCYSNGGRNIVIMQPMKNFPALMFFKGALLADPEGLLEEQGPNSRSARRLCITSVGDVKARTKAAKQTATREARVDKCAEKIPDGKGLRDR